MRALHQACLLPPALTVEAGYAKHRRTNALPLQRDFAERIQS